MAQIAAMREGRSEDSGSEPVRVGAAARRRLDGTAPPACGWKEQRSLVAGFPSDWQRY
ncbi:hypothetical protein BOSEA31B_10797 [Hyphomicrobiales bacterium]|nr:hypothetical protein BOSEA31B_10797 [Hyphomicrobiales bacterium]CAH1700649.1 hypothetical protein BOSEA1005_20348 [Hyphomicrobiales bacterium]CAI0344497.1 hypothetical protein BO1005MUT1_330164 [Hyphomicrobiales bacterium]